MRADEYISLFRFADTRVRQDTSSVLVLLEYSYSSSIRTVHGRAVAFTCKYCTDKAAAGVA